jgi:protein TonB
MQRQQGTAFLYFAMDRNGQVLDYRLERSSGHALLDREVEAMIKRAEPLPRLPESWQQTRLELVVPIQFALR